MVQSAGFQGTNRIQLKNPDISGDIFTLRLTILISNSQCVEGARRFQGSLIEPDYLKTRLIFLSNFKLITKPAQVRHHNPKQQ